jgi:hypothetical protein
MDQMNETVIIFKIIDEKKKVIKKDEKIILIGEKY